MSCLIKKHIITYMFFFFCFVFVSVLYSPGVNAVADLTGTLDSNTPANTPLCNNNDQNLPNCSDYTYVIFESSDPNLPSTGFWNIDLFYNIRLPYSPYIVIKIDSRCNSVWTKTMSYTYTYTFTNSLGSLPSGSITLSENGSYDVSSYAEAVVDVPPSVVQGDYHDDLVNVKHAIYIGIASLFVIYFFYCIYRMIIKGVK